MKNIFFLLLITSVLSALDPILDIANSGMNYFEKLNAILMENMVNVKTPGFKEVKLFLNMM